MLVDDELNEAAKQVKDKLKNKVTKEKVDVEAKDLGILQQYAIEGRYADFEEALRDGGISLTSGDVMSLKSTAKVVTKHGKGDKENSGKKRGKEDGSKGSKSSKKGRSERWEEERKRCSE